MRLRMVFNIRAYHRGQLQSSSFLRPRGRSYSNYFYRKPSEQFDLRSVNCQTITTKLCHQSRLEMAKGKSRNIHGGYKGGRVSTANSRGSKKPPLTHFLCFPLVTSVSRPQLEQSLQHFQKLTLDTTSPSLRASSNNVGASLPIETQQQTENRSSSRQELPAKAIRPVGTLHLTIGVLSLETEDQLEGATNLLQSLDVRKLLEDVVKELEVESNLAQVKDTKETHAEKSISSITAPPMEKTSVSLQWPISPPPTSRSLAFSSNSTQDPIVVSLVSLISMHAPTSTSVLYAAPEDPTNRLLHLGCRLRSIFEDNEYMVKDTRPLKLHATIVNTIYAKPGGRFGNVSRNYAQPSKSEQQDTQEQETTTNPPKGNEKKTEDNSVGEEKSSGKSGGMRHSTGPPRIDATLIMEQFKDFTWAKNFRIEKIAICKMGAQKVTNEQGDIVGEEYEEVASIPLP